MSPKLCTRLCKETPQTWALLSHFREALGVTSDLSSDGFDELPGGILVVRSQQQGSRTDLVCVMKCYLARLALPSRPIGHLMQVITLVDFALGLLIRFKEDDTLDDLRLVIDNFATALSLCPLEHPGVPSSWNTPVLSFRASSIAEMQSMQYFCYYAFSNTFILRVPPSLSACTTDHPTQAFYPSYYSVQHPFLYTIASLSLHSSQIYVL
ncbi:hypothetical protein BDR06DRAFT_174454 [Suillus hirtellus]|nr:hypothetical protein BDR06DRAFT_174454 [Suillus hirtellus]